MLSVLTVYIICPCVIIDSFQIEFSQEKLHGLVVAFVVALTAQLVLILLGHFLRKPMKLSPVEYASFIYSNGGNLLDPAGSVPSWETSMCSTPAPLLAPRTCLCGPMGSWSWGDTPRAGRRFC